MQFINRRCLLKGCMIVGFFVHQSVQAAAAHRLVDILKVNPHIRIDARYASTRNFTGTPVYWYGGRLVLDVVAKKLDEIQHELEEKGYGLLLWDTYRTLREQRKLYDIACSLGGIVLEHISNPSTTPGYKNRGYHIELTLVDLEGNPLIMPTDFDELNEKTSSNYQDLAPEVLQNRQILHEIMTRHGFINFKKEWWYWRLDNPNWREEYPPIELSDEEIDELLQNV